MSARFICLTLTLFFFIEAAVRADDTVVPPSPALLLWQRGQESMRQGEPDAAVEWYQRSLKLDPHLSCNQLSLAAAYLEKGEDEKAAAAMECYLAARPDHHVIRLHFAELLTRLQRPESARRQLERFVADVQQLPEFQEKYLVDGHSRLMELAEAMDDPYREHLHRGIGLYLLGCHVARMKETPPETTAEALLCRAAAELTLARLEKPGSARAYWYLHEVWSQLAQSQPAARWLRAAERAAPFSDLTPAERRGLEAACRDWKTEKTRR